MTEPSPRAPAPDPAWVVWGGLAAFGALTAGGRPVAGGMALAAAMAVCAVMRLVLPEAWVASIVVRSRALDVLTLAALTVAMGTGAVLLKT